MVMHVIIDGYNLLGARERIGRHAGLDSEAARERLVRELAAYRQQKAHPLTVVFDGWQQGVGAERHEYRSGVEVVYSRRGERADQVIQRLAAEYGRDCAVVSSDREVADFAKAHGAFVISAVEFDAKLRARPAPGSLAGLAQKDAADEELPRRRSDKKGNPRKLPKALRKRSRQLRGF